MNYVLLEKIGKGVVKSISLNQLEKIIQESVNANNKTIIS